MREAPIQKTILEWLAAKRIRTHRLNSGKIILSSGGKNRAVLLAPKGTADILALVPCYDSKGFMPLYIETKADTKQSPEQKFFEQDVIEDGFRYIIAKSVDDVEEAVRAI